jgi:hypothetical protein
VALYNVNIDVSTKPNINNYIDQAGLWIGAQNNDWFIDAEDQTEADAKIAQATAWFNAFDHIAAAKQETMGRLRAETTARLTALESDADQTMLHTAVLQKLIANAGLPINQWPQGDQDDLGDLRDRLDAIDALAAAADVIAADVNAQTEFWDAYSYDVTASTHWPTT